jgi:hypothetical protein
MTLNFFNVPNDCKALAGPGPFKLITSPNLDAGSCAADGGQPVGTVTPAGPMSFCCTMPPP